MTKTELMETYTAEQLAEMVVELQNELNSARNLQNEVLFEERIAENIRKTTGMNIEDVRKTLQDTKKYMNDKYVEELQSEVEKYCKAFEDAKKKRDCQIAEYQKKIEELKRDLEYKDGTKMFETLMKNTSGEAQECLARHMYENLRRVFRHEKTADDVSISDFLPTEPIKVADMLINAVKEERNPNGGLKFIRHIFPISELGQIAEHLLVYCNHNGEVEG